MTSAFVGRHELGDDLVDPYLGDGLCGRFVIAGQQHGSQSEVLEPGDRIGGGSA